MLTIIVITLLGGMQEPDVEAHAMNGTPEEPPKPPRLQNWRDGLLFVVGLILVIREAVFATADRPDLLILYAAMMGLPAYLFTQRNGK